MYCFVCLLLFVAIHQTETGIIDIIRYLGGRFPETTSAVDENGRTALHYAAAIKDNGHFYNLLVHLGANPKAIDNVSYQILLDLVYFNSYFLTTCSVKSSIFPYFFPCHFLPNENNRGFFCIRPGEKIEWNHIQFGRTADYYLDTADRSFAHGDLLKSFGVAENVIDDMLIDQGS